MKVVIQRVLKASVEIDNKSYSSINSGLLVLLGIEDLDDSTDVEWLVNKIINIRIFEDLDGLMNLSLKDIDGELLLVSQFTLHASTKKGNRPSYKKAAKSNISEPLYNKFIKVLEETMGENIKTGVFGEYMKVSLLNDGPVTIIIDSKDRR